MGFEQDVNNKGSSSNDNTSFDETTGSAQAFRVLKQLIRNCLTDVLKSGNIYADSILQRLSWWLCRYDYATSCNIFTLLLTHKIPICNFIL